jgi:hypothetical protein
MKDYKTQLIVHIMSHIDFVKEDAVHHRGRGNHWPDEPRQRDQNLLRAATGWLGELGLNTTKILLEQLQRDLANIGTEGAMSKADCVRDVLEAELKAHRFFVLQSDTQSYYEDETRAGPIIQAKWKSTNSELVEAGNCLALNRYRACVFHCCLACEAVLIALGKQLGVKKQNDWGKWISGIRDKLKPVPGAKKTKKLQFRADCVDRLEAIRICRRNPASHFGLQLEPYYTENEAKETLDRTAAFLAFVATEIKPPKAKLS